jgi:hypothetical protein
MESLHPERLMSAASRQVGLSEWGDTRFVAGLERLCTSLDGEAELDVSERERARANLVVLLCSRLRVEQGYKQFPGCAAAVIPRPLIIVGPARTGTTLLHRLMALAQGTRTFTTWEMDQPFPPPERDSYQSDERRSKAWTLYELARKRMSSGTAQAFDVAHHSTPDEPEECRALLSRTFTSRYLVLDVYAPSYLRFVFAQDGAWIHAEHRRQVQALVWRHGGDRLLLKSPMHLTWLDALGAAYPDAGFIWTHRDVHQALGSSLSLLERYRRRALSDQERTAMGRLRLEIADTVWNRAIEHRDRMDASRFCDVAYDQLLADPLTTARVVYSHFGVELDDGSLSRMRAWLEQHPQNRFGVHQYRLEDYGLTRDEVSERLAGYRRRFAPYLEAPASSRVSA